jgi:dTMP kinase
MKKGKLIVIDGTDTSFKETQVKMVLEKLVCRGISCNTMDFPRYREQPTGRIIGQCYLGKDPDFYGWTGDSGWFPEGAAEVHPLQSSALYSMDRHREQTKLKEWLMNVDVVLLDRYDSANKIHQGGKIAPEKRIEFWEKIDWLEYNYFGNLRPDMTILLHNPTEVAMQISKTGNEKKDQHEGSLYHLKNAEESALQAADYYGWNVVECAKGVTRDSLKSREEINEEVMKIIYEGLKI